MACIPKYMNMSMRTCSIVNQTDLPYNRTPPVPLDTLLLPHDTVATIKPYTRRHPPTVLTMERGVEVRVERLREIHCQDADGTRCLLCWVG